MKWADYCVSKFAWENGDEEGRIESVFAKEDLGDRLGEGAVRSRAWVLKELAAGRTFALVDRNEAGTWENPEPLTLNDSGGLHYPRKLPLIAPATKVFVSFYHEDDGPKRQSFDRLTSDLFTNKSVADGDIDSDLSADYIRQLIQKGYLNDTTVLVVLVGPNTRHRKHVDWEIAGALDFRVGDRYAGLLGLLLPTHPDYGKTTYNRDNLPARLAANAKSEYAVIADWTTNRRELQRWVHLAYDRRADPDKLVNKTVPRMERNTGP